LLEDALTHCAASSAAQVMERRKDDFMWMTLKIEQVNSGPVPEN